MAKSLELPVADDYKPSTGEINNFVYLIMKYTIGWSMRQADLAVCCMMAGGHEMIVGNEGLSLLAEHTCEYTWDHLCGEPEEPTADTLFEHMKPILQEWYKVSTVEERAKID